MTYFVLLLISVQRFFVAHLENHSIFSCLSCGFDSYLRQNNDMASSKKRVIGLMRSNDTAAGWCWWCWRVGPSVVRVCAVCVCRMSFQLEIAFFNFLNVMWCMIRFTMHYVYMLGKRVQPEIDRYCSALHIFPLAKQLQFSSKTWQCLQFEKIMCAHTRILNVKNWCRCCRRFSWIFMAIIRSKAKLTGLRAKPFPVNNGKINQSNHNQKLTNRCFNKPKKTR